MKFISGKFPESSAFQPERDGWKSLKEPQNLWLVQLFAIPFMVFNLILLVTAVSVISIDFSLKFNLSFLLGFLVVFPVHELIHAVTFPGGLSSESTYIGAMPKQLVFFAYYTEEMSKARFLITLIAPFVLITAVGLFFIKLFGNNNFILALISVNALGACGDMLGFFLCLFQIPWKAVIRNKGMKTYWRIKTLKTDDTVCL